MTKRELRPFEGTNHKTIPDPDYVPPRGRPRTWTQGDIEGAAQHVAKVFTTAQIRKRQMLIREQQRLAWEQCKPDASEDLEVMEQVEARAVDIREF